MSKAEQSRAREQYLKDYVAGALSLFWQRHAMYFGAFVLAVSYYGATTGIVSYFFVLLTETFDHLVARRISDWDDHDPRKTDCFYRLILLGTVLNAASISLFVVFAAVREGTNPHFTPLLFLFAAALFAAMNTHQILPALTIRLAIYAVAFLKIATQNIIGTQAPMSSYHWLHFFTVMFVMYFIVDCSLVFLKMYRRNLKQLEDLRSEHAAAVEASHAKSEFLSVVSHELRTPITSIKGSLNLVCSGKVGDLPPNAEHMLAIASRNADRLAALIDDLLDFQAIEAGKLAMTFSDIDITKLAQESIEATGSYLKNKHIQVQYTGTDKAVMVAGDTKQLMQVMGNVLSNAIKFSRDNSSVEVSITTSGDRACILVRDFGKGIPPDREEQVFAAFSQINSSSVRSVNGTGLGMNVSRRIMIAHDGDIAYESELGVGTVFRITLPLSNAGEQVDRTARQECVGQQKALLAAPVMRQRST